MFLRRAVEAFLLEEKIVPEAIIEKTEAPAQYSLGGVLSAAINTPCNTQAWRKICVIA